MALQVMYAVITCAERWKLSPGSERSWCDAHQGCHDERARHKIPSVERVEALASGLYQLVEAR